MLTFKIKSRLLRIWPFILAASIGSFSPALASGDWDLCGIKIGTKPAVVRRIMLSNQGVYGQITSHLEYKYNFNCAVSFFLGETFLTNKGNSFSVLYDSDSKAGDVFAVSRCQTFFDLGASPHYDNLIAQLRSKYGKETYLVENDSSWKCIWFFGENQLDDPNFKDSCYLAANLIAGDWDSYLNYDLYDRSYFLNMEAPSYDYVIRHVNLLAPDPRFYKFNSMLYCDISKAGYNPYHGTHVNSIRYYFYDFTKMRGSVCFLSTFLKLANEEQKKKEQDKADAVDLNL